MKFNIYKESYDNYKIAIKILLSLVVIMFVINLILVLYNLIQVKKPRYVIVPPNLGDKVYIGDEYVDKKYLIAMGYFISDLVGSFTPQDYEKRVNLLLNMTYPDYQGILKNILMKNANSIKNNNVSQLFILTDINIAYYKEKKNLDSDKIVVSPVKGEIDIKGFIVRKIGTSAPIWGTNIKITINYWIKNGTFQIIGLEIKEIRSKNDRIIGVSQYEKVK